MGLIEKVRKALGGITTETAEQEAEAQLIALLPEAARDGYTRLCIAKVVKGQKEWLRQDELCKELAREAEGCDEWELDWGYINQDARRASSARAQAGKVIDAWLEQLAAAITRLMKKVEDAPTDLDGDGTPSSPEKQ